MSYSTETKKAILENQPKKNCCRRILQDAAAIINGEKPEERVLATNALKTHFKCPACFSRAVAGLFVAYGSVTDPNKRYHLELSFKTPEEREAAESLLSDGGIDMKGAVRRGKYILYIKDSGRIEDFLAFTGANRAAFELINSKILHEVRGNANRQMNCDVANINKSIAASERLSEIIKEMEESGAFLRLSPELRETAALRIENPQASMTELGQLHSPQISKSGVKHRLDKILEIYNLTESK